MALYNIPIGFKIFAVNNLHQRYDSFTKLQDFVFTGFLQFQKLLVVSSSCIDFKVMRTCVINHYKCTIHLTFSEDSLFL